MANFYLQLDERKAQFFEYSKEPKQGFEKHEGTKISYRKYYDEGVKGTLKSITERPEEFPTGTVKKLQIVVEKGGDKYFMKLSILNQNKSMNQYTEQLIPVMPNLKVGEDYRFYPYEMEVEYTDKNGTVRTAKNRGISVWTWDLDNNVKLVKVDRAHSFAKDGDIPQVVWEDVEDLEEVKKVKNDRDRRNYLYKIMKSCLTDSTPTEPSQPKEESKPTPPVATESFSEEDHDDLPF